MGEDKEAMFERFDQDARRVVGLVQEQSRVLNHHHIGTEHLFLALIDQPDLAAALEALGLDARRVRDEVLQLAGTGERPPSGHIPFTPGAKKVMELSLRASLERGDSDITPRHLLLGVLAHARQHPEATGQPIFHIFGIGPSTEHDPTLNAEPTVDADVAAAADVVALALRQLDVDLDRLTELVAAPPAGSREGGEPHGAAHPATDPEEDRAEQLRAARARLHALTAVVIALDRRDEVSAVIADSDDSAAARDALARLLDTDESGAQAVLTLHWSAFTRARHDQARDDLEQTRADVRALER